MLVKGGTEDLMYQYLIIKRVAETWNGQGDTLQMAPAMATRQHAQ